MAVASGGGDGDGGSSSDGADGAGHTANSSEALINSCQWQIKSSRLHSGRERLALALAASISMH